MRYADIPSADTMSRLIQVSFSTPAKNLSMYRLYDSLRTHQNYVENERIKLIHKYGEDLGDGNFAVKNPEALKKFRIDFGRTLESIIPDKIECPDIKEEDFLDDNCSYPLDKTMWPSANDIGNFFDFCKILSQENG